MVFQRQQQSTPLFPFLSSKTTSYLPIYRPSSTPQCQQRDAITLPFIPFPSRLPFCTFSFVALSSFSSGLPSPPSSWPNTTTHSTEKQKTEKTERGGRHKTYRWAGQRNFEKMARVSLCTKDVEGGVLNASHQKNERKTNGKEQSHGNSTPNEQTRRKMFKKKTKAVFSSLSSSSYRSLALALSHLLFFFLPVLLLAQSQRPHRLSFWMTCFR